MFGIRVSVLTLLCPPVSSHFLIRPDGADRWQVSDQILPRSSQFVGEHPDTSGVASMVAIIAESDPWAPILFSYSVSRHRKKISGISTGLAPRSEGSYTARGLDG